MLNSLSLRYIPRPTEILERLNLLPRENDKWAVTDNVFTFYFIIIITVYLCMICVSLQEHVVYMLHVYHSTHHMSKDNFQRSFSPSILGSRDQTQTTGSVALSTFTS